MITIIYFIIPSIFLVFGAIGKRIIRGSWEWEDWFLGMELVLAAISTGIMHLFDLAVKLDKVLDAVAVKQVAIDLRSVTLFLFSSILMFFFVVITHQRWQSVLIPKIKFKKMNQMAKWKVIWLAGICNLIGYALFATFIMLVKGVEPAVR